LRSSVEVAWVTGSSKGIGRAVVLGLAEQGCDVVVHYNSSEDDAREVEERIKGFGNDVLMLKGDVTDAGDVRRMVGEIEDRYGRIDILVNSAGSMVKRSGQVAGEAAYLDAVADHEDEDGHEPPEERSGDADALDEVTEGSVLGLRLLTTHLSTSPLLWIPIRG
jgi:NAD(P)-dependent dehydrogenase (short-subunit alcohol dehydrogenase family)